MSAPMIASMISCLVVITCYVKEYSSPSKIKSCSKDHLFTTSVFPKQETTIFLLDNFDGSTIFALTSVTGSRVFPLGSLGPVLKYSALFGSLASGFRQGGGVFA
ncbi:hypothetical protein TNCV_1393961 [Trichonephila clavipes]|nr:hypothetical protein TNCV_1393961 [Trichonephila clavipes]